MAKIELKNSFLLAIPLTIAIWAISYVFGLLKIGVTPLFSTVNLYQTITPTLGTQVWGFISGYIPISFTFPAIALTFISAWATIILGTFLLSLNFPQFLGKGNTGKLASIIFWGGVPVYLLLIGFSIPSIMVFIGALIWILVVAYVSGLAGELMKDLF